MRFKANVAIFALILTVLLVVWFIWGPSLATNGNVAEVASRSENVSSPSERSRSLTFDKDSWPSDGREEKQFAEDISDERVLAGALRDLGFDKKVQVSLVYSLLQIDTPQGRGDWTSSTQAALADARTRAFQRSRLVDLFGKDAYLGAKELFFPFETTLPMASSEQQIEAQDAVLLAEAKHEDLSENMWYIEEIHAARDKIETELDERLQVTLGSEGYYAYQRHYSPGASELRMNLKGAYLQAGEFDDLLELRTAFFHALPDGIELNRQLSPNQARDLFRRYREYLGEARFEVLQQNTDPVYQRLRSIGAFYGEPNRDIGVAYSLLNEHQKNIEKLAARRDLTLDEKWETYEPERDSFYASLDEILKEATVASIKTNIHWVEHPLLNGPD